MERDTAYYAIATIIHSLVTKEGMDKKELEKDISKIIEDMYREFRDE